MPRIVTEQEIEQLHTFCKKHSVKYYDVRIELVDHIATSIETIWEQDENMKFEIALEKIYKSYGATGFRKFMREKEQMVEKTFNKGLKSEIKMLFHWPNILLAICLVAVCWIGYSFYYSAFPIGANYFILGLCVASMIFEIYSRIKIYRLQKSLKNPLIICNDLGFFSFNFITDLVITQAIIQKIIESEFNPNSIKILPNFVFILFSYMCIFSILMTTAHLKYINKSYSNAKANYPMAFKS